MNFMSHIEPQVSADLAQIGPTLGGAMRRRSCMCSSSCLPSVFRCSAGLHTLLHAKKLPLCPTKSYYMFIILSIRFQHCTPVFNQMSVCWFMKWVTSPTRTKEFTPTAGACFRKDGPAALAKHQESSLRSNDHRTRNRRRANVTEHAIISL